MSDLEEKGYLFHPHTSAGRVPTDRAYRLYVDGLIRLAPPSAEAALRLARKSAAPGARWRRSCTGRRRCWAC